MPRNTQLPDKGFLCKMVQPLSLAMFGFVLRENWTCSRFQFFFNFLHLCPISKFLLMPSLRSHIRSAHTLQILLAEPIIVVSRNDLLHVRVNLQFDFVVRRERLRFLSPLILQRRRLLYRRFILPALLLLCGSRRRRCRNGRKRSGSRRLRTADGVVGRKCRNATYIPHSKKLKWGLCTFQQIGICTRPTL